MFTPQEAYELYLVEWYSGWRHFADIELTVGTVNHTENGFTDWSFGTPLLTEDLNLVLSNLQAYGTRDYDINLLIGATPSIEELLQSISSSETIFAKATHGTHYTALIFQEGMHFKTLLFDPEQKSILLFDSLNIISDAVQVLINCLRAEVGQRGWDVKIIGDRRQRDGWSCGLWSIYSIVLTRGYLLRNDPSMSLADYIRETMIQEQRGITNLPRVLFDRFEAGIVHAKDIGRPLVTDSKLPAAIERSHALQAFHNADKSGDQELWQAVKSAKAHSAILQPNLSCSNRFDCLSSEAGDASQDSAGEPQPVSSAMPRQTAAMVPDHSIEGVPMQQQQPSSNFVRPVRGRKKDLRRISKASSLYPIFKKMMSSLDDKMPKNFEVVQYVKEVGRSTLSDKEVISAWNNYKTKIRKSGDCNCKASHPTNFSHLFPIFEEMLQEAGSDFIKMSDVVKACTEDPRCSLAESQVTWAWRRFKKEAKPTGKFNMTQVCRAVFEDDCATSDHEAQSSTQIINRCMEKLISQGCKLTKKQVSQT